MSEKDCNMKQNGKLLTAAMVVSMIALVFALFFPIIIWDALGSGAMHFMQYGGVSVSGANNGSSQATFLFGLGYTLTHMDGGTFIPAQLFSAQWRVVMGVTEANAAADTLGAITMILTVLMFLSLLAMAVDYLLVKCTKIAVFEKVGKILPIVCAVIEGLIVIWFGIIVISMAAKIQPFGFRTYDFMAYGGIKFAIEIAFSLALCILNTFLFLRSRKS